MIATGMVCYVLFHFAANAAHALDKKGLTIRDGVWWFIAAMGVASIGSIAIGVFILAWRNLP